MLPLFSLFLLATAPQAASPVAGFRVDTLLRFAPVDQDSGHRAAEEAIAAGIARFVATISEERLEQVSGLYPEQGDPAWRIGFLSFLASEAPRAALQGVNLAQITNGSAELTFTVSFRWRGHFGLTRRGDARFVARARRADRRWLFLGVNLLAAFP